MFKPLKINVSKLLDPVKLQQVVKYQGNLTATSNDTNIIPRNDAGNVQLEANSSNNPLLIIEPVATRITLDSVLKVLDTQFEYFKFPATVRVIGDTNVDVDLTLPELEAVDTDTTFARYRPSESRRILLAPENPWWEGEKFSGILMDFVEDGAPQKQTNQYQISKNVKESGIDLRFRIQIKHRFDTPTPPLEGSIVNGNIVTTQPPPEVGTAYFSIIKNSPKTPAGGWPPALNKLFRGPFANTSNLAPDTFGSITQYEEQILNIDIVIPNNEFDTGDYFSIGAFAGQNSDSTFHTILPIQSYWSITDASKNVDDWNQEIN